MKDIHVLTWHVGGIYGDRSTTPVDDGNRQKTLKEGSHPLV